MTHSIDALESKRQSLLEQITRIGDMRRGSITEVYRQCGKKDCCCKTKGHPGHGPYYAYTTKTDGKTKTLQLRAGALLTKIEREVESYRRFRELSAELLEVNEAICEARTLEETAVVINESVAKKTSERRSGRKSPKK